MPTKIEVNLETGEVKELELEGEELEAYNASLASQTSELPVSQIPPTPTKEELLAKLLEIQTQLESM
jgi:hypothetical protein